MTQPADLEHLLAHADWLRALASRLVGSDADDAVQETMIAAMRTPPDPALPARPWLGKVLRNVTRMQFRGRSRRAAREDAAALAPAASPGPHEIVERVELQRMLCELVLGLDEPYRRTLVMHYFDGLALADIARADGVPEATVRGRHRDALARMRATLDANNGRKTWLAALAPFAGRAAGGLIVKKLVVALVIAIVAILSVWIARGDRTPHAAPPAPAIALPSAHLTFGQQPKLVGGGGSLHGRVSTAAMIMLVEISDAPIVVARQDGATFDFTDVAAGRYCVVATAGPLSARACDLVLAEGERREVNLELAREAASLHGTVSDADGGAIARPTVLAQRFPQLGMMWAVEGDEAGRYELGLAAGWYRVTIKAPGYTATRSYVEVSARHQLDVKLNAGSTIAGIVLDENRQPVANANVTTLEWQGSGHAAKTDATGRFLLDSLRPGEFDVVAVFGERVSAPRQVTVEFGATQDIEIVVRESKAALVGRVVDEADRPVANCRVELRGAVTRSATTDATGSVRVTGLASGLYNVAATADTFVRASTSAIVTPEAETAVTLRLARGAMISGTVRTATNEPVANATVATSASNLGDPRLDVKTDAAGAFTIGPLPVGEVVLSAFHPARGVTELTKLSVPTSARPELVFRASAKVEGIVRFNDNTPARGAIIDITREDAPARWSLVADDRGHFVIGALPAGEFAIGAHAAGAGSFHAVLNARSFRVLTLAAGASEQVELFVAGGNEQIAGRVRDAAGAPIAGAAIWAEREVPGLTTGAASLDEVRSYSWPDGTFTLDGLPTGSYTLYASHPKLGTGHTPHVSAGSTTATVALEEAAAIEGRVVDGAGKPVRAFRLQWTTRTRESPSGSYATTNDARMFETADGTFTLANLAPTSQLVVSAATTSGASDEVAFPLTPHERKTKLRLVVVGMGTVRGRMLLADGTPALGYFVSFSSSAANDTVPIDGTGRFEAHLPAGTYTEIRLQSETTGYGPISRTFTVTASAVTDLGDLQSAR